MNKFNCRMIPPARRGLRMTARVAKLGGVVVVAATIGSVFLLRPQAAPVLGDWPAYGGSKAGTKYSPLDQINKDTVRNLRVVWRQSATPQAVRQGRSDAPVPLSYEHTPLMVDGLLYISTGFGTVAALDPTTGEVVWFDSPVAAAPGGSSERQPPRGPSSRSLAYWTDGKDAR